MPKGCRPLTKATKAAKKDLCDISTGSSETFSAIKSSKSDRLCKKIHLKCELYCQQNSRIRSINPPPESNPFLIESNKSYHSVPSFHYSETKLLVGLSRIVFLAMLLLCCLPPILVESTKDAARLFDDLLADYNKLVRPVDDNNATLIVKFKLKLSQLLDVVGWLRYRIKGNETLFWWKILLTRIFRNCILTFDLEYLIDLDLISSLLQIRISGLPVEF